MAIRDWFRGKRKPKKRRKTFLLSQEESESLALTPEEKSELNVAGGIELRVGEPEAGPEHDQLLLTLRERLRSYRERGIPLTYEGGEGPMDWRLMEPGPERTAAMNRAEIGAGEGGTRARRSIARTAAETSQAGGLQAKIDRMLDEGYSPEQIHEMYGIRPKARPKKKATAWQPEVMKGVAARSAVADFMAGGLSREEAERKVAEGTRTGAPGSAGGIIGEPGERRTYVGRPTTAAERAEAGMHVPPAALQQEREREVVRKERLRPGIVGALARQPTPVDYNTRVQVESLAACAQHPGALGAALEVYAAKGLSPTLRTAAIAAIAEDPERYAEVESTGVEGLTEAEKWKIATNIATVSPSQISTVGPEGEATTRDETVDEIYGRLFGGAGEPPGQPTPTGGPLPTEGRLGEPGRGGHWFQDAQGRWYQAETGGLPFPRPGSDQPPTAPAAPSGVPVPAVPSTAPGAAVTRQGATREQLLAAVRQFLPGYQGGPIPPDVKIQAEKVLNAQGLTGM